VALAGTEDASSADLIANILGSDAPVELTLLHVLETEPRELAAFDPGIRRGPWPLPSRNAVETRLDAADDAKAEALLAIWRERFAKALPGAEISHLVAKGRPEREIVAAAQRLNPDAVVLSARPRSDPDEAGPRSVGHVARFVLDHSPVPVLLVRRSV
jgi:nucleotide-binding universal stress UspA family protein